MNGKLLAYKGDNKKLMIIPGASHTDLYDQKTSFHLMNWKVSLINI